MSIRSKSTYAASRLNHSARDEHSWNVNLPGLGVSSQLGRRIAGILTLERPCVSLCPWDARARLLPDLVDHVELVARQVVADPVARILGEPVFSSARIDVAADRVGAPRAPRSRR